MTYPMSDFECEQEQRDIEALAEELMLPGGGYYPFSKANFIEAISEMGDSDIAEIQKALNASFLGVSIYNYVVTKYWRPIAREAAEQQITRNRQ